MGDTPSDEQIGISGNKRRARIVRRKLNEMLFSKPDHVYVLVENGETLGLIKLGAEDGGVTPGLAWAVVRTFGFGTPRFLSRLSSRRRVDFETPTGALHIAEVHVREDQRGKGYGELLLRHAEEIGVARHAPKLSLTTTTANPARRLYERFGFTVTATKTDPEYERLT